MEMIWVGEMTKRELVREISGLTSLQQKAVDNVLAAFMEVVAQELSEGGSVTLRGFGTFKAQNRQGKVGRNPHTGEEVRFPARYEAHFEPSPALNQCASRYAEK